MEFSAALSKPPETEWSELRLTKCARQAASPLSTKPFGFVDSLSSREAVCLTAAAGSSGDSNPGGVTLHIEA